MTPPVYTAWTAKPCYPAPACCSTAARSPPAVAHQDGLHAHSLVPLLDGRRERVRDYAFTQWEDYVFCIRGERWKLTWYDADGCGELYDLAEDPWEQNNLYDEADTRGIRDDLLARLQEWRNRYARPQDMPTG